MGSKRRKLLVAATTLTVCVGEATITAAQDKTLRVPGGIQGIAEPQALLRPDLICEIQGWKTGSWGFANYLSNGGEYAGDDLYLNFRVRNVGSVEAKDFFVQRSITKQSDKQFSGQGPRRMNVDSETVSLKGDEEKELPGDYLGTSTKIPLVIGETAVIRATMLVDKDNVVAETNKTNNSCSYQITYYTWGPYQLVVDHVAHYPAPATEGQAITISINVQNEGYKSNDDFTLHLECKNAQSGGPACPFPTRQWKLESIAPQSGKTLQLLTSPSWKAGTYELRAWVSGPLSLVSEDITVPLQVQGLKQVQAGKLPGMVQEPLDMPANANPQRQPLPQAGDLEAETIDKDPEPTPRTPQPVRRPPNEGLP